MPACPRPTGYRPSGNPPSRLPTCPKIGAAPPEDGRRPSPELTRAHPYQQNAGNRCASGRLRWSRSTADGKVMWSRGVQLCALILSLLAALLNHNPVLYLWTQCSPPQLSCLNAADLVLAASALHTRRLPLAILPTPARDVPDRLSRPGRARIGFPAWKRRRLDPAAVDQHGTLWGGGGRWMTRLALVVTRAACPSLPFGWWMSVFQPEPDHDDEGGYLRVAKACRAAGPGAGGGRPGRPG
jgi:hypothetical protein